MQRTLVLMIVTTAAVAALVLAERAETAVIPHAERAARIAGLEESGESPPMLTFHRPTIGRTADSPDAARTLPVAVYLPPGYEAGEVYPLIIFLHGSGERGDDGLRAAAVGLGPAVLRHPERWPCIIAFPQIRPGEEWMNLADLPAQVAAWAMAEHRIDPDRVYLTGLSNGGGGTWAAASATPEMWAAIAPVCGWNAIGRGKADAARLVGLPAWAFHGEKDDVIPASDTQKMADAVIAAGGSVKVTIFPGVNHGSWDPAYAEPGLPKWLLSQKRSAH